MLDAHVWPNQRAACWQLRTRRLEFGTFPHLMGIVNVTPDSFSDGGKFLESQQAVAHAMQLVAEGADILDIGGESTRPYAEPVDEREELQRVLPVIEQLAKLTTVPLSIDTSKPRVAAEAIAAGAEIINDVTGLEHPQMRQLAAETGVGVCAMHMQGTPQTMQDNPRYEDVVGEILKYLLAQRDALQAAGLEAERICLDPGIGFGKTLDHNLRLLQQCQIFHQTGCPVLVGHSRKGFLRKVLNRPTGEGLSTDATAATLGVAISLLRRGIQVIRIHDVGAVQAALRLYQAVETWGSQESR